MKRRLVVLAALGAVAAGVLATLAITGGSGGSGSSGSTPTGHAALADANGVPSENVDAVRHDIAGGALVLDVRQDDEFAAGRVVASMHIPLAQVQDRTSELPKGRMIVTVCRDGGRSYKAAYALRQAGYDAVNLDGGLTAWVAAGQPLVDDSGGPGHLL